MIEVTESDRQTAADIWRDYIAKVGECMVERSMREGALDDGLPTIIATHRTQAAKAERDRLLSDDAIDLIVRAYVQAGKRGVTNMAQAFREAIAAALDSKP